ncbi:MAG: hypothetical protein ACOY82_06235 [Pseudomonadota bacterium]
MNESSSIAQNIGADIARRNRKRNVEARDRRLMLLLFGMMAFIGTMGTIGSVIEFAEGVVDPWVLGQGFGLSMLYLLAASRLWFHDDMRLWVVAAPIVIPMIAMAVEVALGLSPPGVPVFNLLMLGLVLLRRRTLAAARAEPRLSATPV